MNKSFNNCIADICGLELSALLGEYKYSVFGGNTFVIEGHKGVAEYSEEAVSFYVGKNILKVSGKGLKIKCLDKSFAVVRGDIFGVSISKADPSK